VSGVETPGDSRNVVIDRSADFPHTAYSMLSPIVSVLYWCFTYDRLQLNSYQFAVMTLLEEFVTISVLNELSACKMLLLLRTLITCTIYIGGIFLNLCIKDAIVG